MEQAGIPVTGEALKKRRKELGLTQRAIADALGITASAVSSWEADTSAPLNKHIFKLMQILQYDVPNLDLRVEALEAKIVTLREEVAALAELLAQALEQAADQVAPLQPAVRKQKRSAR